MVCRHNEKSIYQEWHKTELMKKFKSMYLRNIFVLSIMFFSSGVFAQTEIKGQKAIYELEEIRKLAEKEHWTIYQNNPVIKLGESGTWDSWTMSTPNILKVGDTIHMYYEAGSSGLIDFQIGHAVSTDGIHWDKDPNNPIIPFGRAGEWDDKETWDPFVIYEDGIFKMWYGGTTLLDDGRRNFQIGYAISADGSNFTKVGKISHFSPRGSVGDMHVVHDPKAGKYYMYYLDRNYKPFTLFRAESPNETDFDFDHAEKIVIEGEEGVYRCPHVIVEGDKWYMLYSYKYQDRAGIACSDDGLNWKAQNTNILSADDPEILKIADDLYLLFYCPVEFHMGHEPGSDIRVAIYNGSLDEL
jgi:predicted GH43/DUF377 family glycosyl hydrolase